ncbi:hypothetical protein DKX38_028298 [Salix brachista]|uniref:F-box domain-containing protein n=1 Tax=Salix brachista TaxID=2182728 RepID=A0A5N5J6E4_9ROSI|nr:hypothetical protein DKX38_028298 [Salix brachista]
MVRPVIESSLWSKRENQIVVLMMKKCSADTISSCNDSLYSSCFITTNDYINRLPDDVLVTILSRLTFREVGRTSVFSRRWRCLWKFYPGLLDFDASSTMLKMKNKSYEERELILPIEQHKFEICEFSEPSLETVSGFKC